MSFIVSSIARTSSEYPGEVELFLRNDSPEQIYCIGSLEIISKPKVALFCSSRCPGEAILQTYDLAQRLRAEGRTVISGFHSPMEKECLNVLLRSRNAVVLCPARGLDAMRIRREWSKPIADGRMLLLSPFPPDLKRATAKDGYFRNMFVAALAEDVIIAHAARGSKVDQLRAQISEWGKPVLVLSNENP